MVPLPYPFRRLSVVSPDFLGTTRNVGLRSTARIRTSPPCWLTSKAGMRGHQCRKKRSYQKDVLAIVATLSLDLRGLRNRTILLLGYASGLRRSEIVGLDAGKDDTQDSGGWLEILEDGAILMLNAKTGWREVEIGRGPSEQTCPVRACVGTVALHFAKTPLGPRFFRRIFAVGGARLGRGPRKSVCSVPTPINSSLRARPVRFHIFSATSLWD